MLLDILGVIYCLCFSVISFSWNEGFSYLVVRLIGLMQLDISAVITINVSYTA